MRASLEYDGRHCDTIICRWEAFTGKEARLADFGQFLDDIADERLGLKAAHAASFPEGPVRDLEGQHE